MIKQKKALLFWQMFDPNKNSKSWIKCVFKDLCGWVSSEDVSSTPLLEAFPNFLVAPSLIELTVSCFYLSSGLGLISSLQGELELIPAPTRTTWHWCCPSPSHLFAEASFVLHDTVVHVAAVAQLQNEVELGGRVNDLVETHHVGVLHHLHAADLLEEVTSSHRVQLGLIDDFYRNLEEIWSETVWVM